MNIKFNLSPLNITKNITLIFVILSLVNLVVQLAKYGFDYREEWMVIFNMDREMNFPTLYTVILLVVCAILLKQIALLERKYKNNSIQYWKILHFIFLFLALDEGLQIHEIFIIPAIGEKLPGIFHFVWVIPYGIATVIAIYYFSKFVADLPTRIKNFFLLSALFYLGGVLGIEMLAGVWVRIAGGMQNLVYSLIVSVEEMMEITGLIIFIYSLLIYITQHHHESIKIRIDIS